jgi:glycogen(starch) synthase
MVLTAPPTALWVIPVSDLAGVARHTLDVAREGIPGWRVVFLAPPGDLPRELKAVGAAVLESPFGPGHGLRASVTSLRHAVTKLRPDVVHTHLSYADIVAALSVGRGPRLVTTEHGIAHDDLVYHRSVAKARVMAVVHTARLRRFDAAIAVSRATAEAMGQKWHPRRAVTVIHNGLDRRSTPTRSPGLRVLSLARLAPEKRLDRLVDAFALLAGRHPEATLTLAGTGPLGDALRRQVAELDLDGRVRFPGFVDPDAALADHDVLAMLSVWENCSYALLDAAAAGLGVVASGVGGNPEMLPGRCLVDATDASQVAGALARQGREPSQRPGLDDWSTVASMTQRISDVYAATAGTRR